MAILLLIVVLLSSIAAAANPIVTVLTIDDAITPATAEYFERGLKHAAESGSSLVVLRLDTPGGLDTSMRDMIKRILASPIPVVAFVWPGGARAASAGTYILYASHVAAMAPGTNLGAATPVNIGLGGPQSEPAPTPEPKPGDTAAEKRPAAKSTLHEKQIHDSAAYIRSLAQLRHRNADWAEKAVREAVSLPAADALAMHVVDVVAPDVPTLLANVQGKHVSVAGKEVVLEVAGAEQVLLDPDWRVRLLSVIASPSLALILMMLGFYGVVFEFASPGYVLPGVIGGICLILALFAFQLLPFTYTGLGLVALGLAFLVAELFVPTSGVLAAGGIVALVIGAVLLFDTDVPGYGVSWAVIASIAAVTGLFMLLVLGVALAARRRRVVTGQEELLGSAGEVMADFVGEGWAQVHGETWHVYSRAALQKGQRVRVIAMDGLRLEVEPEPSRTGGTS